MYKKYARYNVKCRKCNSFICVTDAIRVELNYYACQNPDACGMRIKQELEKKKRSDSI